MPFDANQNVVTNFTKVVHRKPYPTISVSRPELSQAGKTMLVTGGATGIGFGIVQSFIKAGAEKVIIVARREDVLKAAADDLKAQFGDASTIVTQTCDQTDRAAVRGLWAGFQSQGVFVDVLVLNAANFANVRGPLDMVEGFNKQTGDKRKVILNVSSQVTNMLDESQLFPSGKRPVYGLTKSSGTLLIQQIAKDVTPDKLQIISFHPGLIYNAEWKRMGIKDTDLPFDDSQLPGSFSVWATTGEASFLHGRFVWTSWDIDEYSKGEDRKRLEESVDYLRIGVVGLRGSFRA